MRTTIRTIEGISPVPRTIDITKEIERLEKELDKWTKEVERVEKKLSNQGFISKAPAKIVDEERAKQADYDDKRSRVQQRINELKG